MKKKKLLVVLLLALSFYLVFFFRNEMTYAGANDYWQIEYYNKKRINNNVDIVIEVHPKFKSDNYAPYIRYRIYDEKGEQSFGHLTLNQQGFYTIKTTDCNGCRFYDFKTIDFLIYYLDKSSMVTLQKSN